MATLKEVTLLMDSKALSELEKKGFAEIVSRQKNGKFKSMIKYAISRTNDASTKDILYESLKRQALTNKQFTSAFKSVNKNLGNISEKLIGMSSELRNVSSSVDAVFANTNLIKNLSFLNTGLSAANLGVNIAGFVIISAQLNNMEKNLNKSLSRIEKNVEKLTNFNEIEFRSIAHEIVLEFNDMCQTLVSGGHVELTDQRKFMDKMNTYCHMIVDFMNEDVMDMGMLLDVLFSILPAYSTIFENFIYDYYFEKKMMPASYKEYLSVFSKILDDSLIQKIADHLFLNQKLSSEETFNAINALEGSVLSYATGIIDRADLVKMIRDKNQYDQLMNDIDMSVKEELDNEANDIAKLIGKSTEECQNVLQQAYAVYLDKSALYS